MCYEDTCPCILISGRYTLVFTILQRGCRQGSVLSFCLPSQSTFKASTSQGQGLLSMHETLGATYQEQSPHQRDLGRTQVWNRCSR